MLLNVQGNPKPPDYCLEFLSTSQLDTYGDVNVKMQSYVRLYMPVNGGKRYTGRDIRVNYLYVVTLKHTYLFDDITEGSVEMREVFYYYYYFFLFFGSLVSMSIFGVSYREKHGG